VAVESGNPTSAVGDGGLRLNVEVAAWWAVANSANAEDWMNRRILRKIRGFDVWESEDV
jgi:hypothetical protein